MLFEISVSDKTHSREQGVLSNYVPNTDVWQSCQGLKYTVDNQVLAKEDFVILLSLCPSDQSVDLDWEVRGQIWDDI